MGTTGDQDREGNERRWLTAGSLAAPLLARLYAVVLFVGSLRVFFDLLGFRDVRLAWTPALAAVALSAPLYLVLRRGDRRVEAWWARRRPSTRLLLRRGARTACAGVALAFAFFLLSRGTDGRAPDPVPVAVGLAFLGFALWNLILAGRDRERRG